MENQAAERQVWTNINAGEVVPDVMTPATWSFIELMAGRLFKTVFGQIGLDLGDNLLLGEINGRLYFNLNILIGAGRRLPMVSKIDITKALGGHQADRVDRGLLKIEKEDIPDLGFSRLKFFVRLPLVLIWFGAYQPARWPKYSKEIWAKASEGLWGTLADSDELQLYSQAEDLLNYLTTRGLKTVNFSLAGMLYYNELDSLCRKWLDDTDGSLAGRQVTGLSGVESAEAGLDFWRLAELASSLPDVAVIVRHIPNFSIARERLQVVTDGDVFLEAWDKFIRRHGHHAIGEIELYNPRWSEMPDYVLATVKSHLGALGKNDPLHTHSRIAEERAELTRECLARLRNPFRRRFFSFILRRAQQSGIVRENGKSAAIACIAGIRRILLELGERFVSQGRIDVADDIFFLRFEEISEAVSAQEPSDLEILVDQRKTQFVRNKILTPPPVVVGTWDETADEVEVPYENGTLEGLAASPGLVTGPARVILRSDVDERVLPGEILVAPYTDPGWTPYLIAAAAVVTDLGGRLSHGSIIARECGVPAVVNTQTATKIIKTGQTITVDGNKGTVTL